MNDIYNPCSVRREKSYTVTLLLLCMLLILTSCTTFSPTSSAATPMATRNLAKNTPMPTPTPLTNAALADALVKTMTLDEKLGQMVIVEFYGPTVDADLTQMIQNQHVSGVLIENKNGNAQTKVQLMALDQGMQRLARVPLFISTDFEGGVVNELRRITGERPSDARIGVTGNTQIAYDAGHNAAVDLSSLGLNLNYMPIVDVLTNPNNPGLPQRTFGSDSTLVTNMGRAYLKGLTDGGVIGCLKHFPGLGGATLDPHYALPTVNRSAAMLNAVDLVPYRTMINEGIVPMVMVTHIHNPQLDPNLPTSLSPNVVTKLLRGDLNFQGVIISDTLWMGGISNTYDLAQAAVLAVKAGTDLLLGPRGLAETQEMLYGLKQAVISGQISESEIDASVSRILQLKLQYNIFSRDKAIQMARGSLDSETRGN